MVQKKYFYYMYTHHTCVCVCANGAKCYKQENLGKIKIDLHDLEVIYKEKVVKLASHSPFLRKLIDVVTPTKEWSETITKKTKNPEDWEPPWGKGRAIPGIMVKARLASSQETKRTTNPTWSRRTERFQKDIPPIPQNDINRLPDCVERSLQFFQRVWEELVVVKKKAISNSRGK